MARRTNPIVKPAGTKKAPRPQKNKKGRKPVSARKGGGKRWIGVLVFVILVGLAINAVMMMQKTAPRQFKVLPVFSVTGNDKSSGPFGAWDAAAVGNDRVAVADQPAGRILLFDRNGDLLKTWGRKGETGDTFKEPSGIISDASGNIWVLDAWRSIVRGFTQNGDELAKIPLVDRFYGPRGVASNGKDFFVADTGSHRVVQVAPSGQVVAFWGEQRGTGRQSLDNPRSLCVDSKGLVYVADYENRRIQVLDIAKGFLRQVKCDCKPADVAIDAKGRLFVPCVEDGLVKVFSAGNGKFLGAMVDPNGAPDAFRGQSGVDVAPDGTVILGGGDRVSGWKPAS